LPESDLDLLIEAAREAAEIAVRYWQTDQTVRDKGDGAGPVSEGDLAVDTHLRETLTRARPYAWLSEETEDDRARLDADTVFIVDPIDGTRAYVAGHRTWAHSLAVAHRGQVTAGVVYLPLRDKMYTATRGGGAWLNGRPIAASPRVDLPGAQILAPKPSLDPAHWPGGVPDVERHFRPSLAYRLSLVAEGRFDAMLTLRDCWEWDIAAGSLIAAEARAAATDRHGHALAFNSPRGKTPGVLVAGRTLHPRLVAGLTA
jgi:myo-inositol-1(or 4)-monophosphatase